jgi:hypothetical protein
MRNLPIIVDENDDYYPSYGTNGTEYPGEYSPSQYYSTSQIEVAPKASTLLAPEGSIELQRKSSTSQIEEKAASVPITGVTGVTGVTGLMSKGMIPSEEKHAYITPIPVPTTSLHKIPSEESTKAIPVPVSSSPLVAGSSVSQQNLSKLMAEESYSKSAPLSSSISSAISQAVSAISSYVSSSNTATVTPTTPTKTPSLTKSQCNPDSGICSFESFQSIQEGYKGNRSVSELNKVVSPKGSSRWISSDKNFNIGIDTIAVASVYQCKLKIDSKTSSTSITLYTTNKGYLFMNDMMYLINQEVKKGSGVYTIDRVPISGSSSSSQGAVNIYVLLPGNSAILCNNAPFNTDNTGVWKSHSYDMDQEFRNANPIQFGQNVIGLRVISSDQPVYPLANLPLPIQTQVAPNAQIITNTSTYQSYTRDQIYGNKSLRTVRYVVPNPNVMNVLVKTIINFQIFSSSSDFKVYQISASTTNSTTISIKQVNKGLIFNSTPQNGYTLYSQSIECTLQQGSNSIIIIAPEKSFIYIPSFTLPSASSSASTPTPTAIQSLITNSSWRYMMIQIPYDQVDYEKMGGSLDQDLWAKVKSAAAASAASPIMESFENTIYSEISNTVMGEEYIIQSERNRAELKNVAATKSAIQQYITDATNLLAKPEFNQTSSQCPINILKAMIKDNTDDYTKVYSDPLSGFSAKIQKIQDIHTQMTTDIKKALLVDLSTVSSVAGIDAFIRKIDLSIYWNNDAGSKAISDFTTNLRNYLNTYFSVISSINTLFGKKYTAITVPMKVDIKVSVDANIAEMNRVYTTEEESYKKSVSTAISLLSKMKDAATGSSPQSLAMIKNTFDSLNKLYMALSAKSAEYKITSTNMIAKYNTPLKSMVSKIDLPAFQKYQANNTANLKALNASRMGTNQIYAESFVNQTKTQTPTEDFSLIPATVQSFNRMNKPVPVTIKTVTTTSKTMVEKRIKDGYSLVKTGNFLKIVFRGDTGTENMTIQLKLDNNTKIDLSVKAMGTVNQTIYQELPPSRRMKSLYLAFTNDGNVKINGKINGKRVDRNIRIDELTYNFTNILSLASRSGDHSDKKDMQIARSGSFPWDVGYNYDTSNIAPVDYYVSYVNSVGSLREHRVAAQAVNLDSPSSSRLIAKVVSDIIGPTSAMYDATVPYEESTSQTYNSPTLESAAIWMAPTQSSTPTERGELSFVGQFYTANPIKGKLIISMSNLDTLVGVYLDKMLLTPSSTSIYEYPVSITDISTSIHFIQILIHTNQPAKGYRNNLNQALDQTNVKNVSHYLSVNLVDSSGNLLMTSRDNTSDKKSWRYSYRPLPISKAVMESFSNVNDDDGKVSIRSPIVRQIPSYQYTSATPDRWGRGEGSGMGWSIQQEEESNLKLAYAYRYDQD